MPRVYVPDTADVVWLEFDPQAGHEQAGHRPALVISPASCKLGHCVAIYRANSTHDAPGSTPYLLSSPLVLT